MANIPLTADEITADWINEVTGWGVTSIDKTEIGAGRGVVSQVHRVTLEGGSGPASVVTKTQATDEAAAMTATVLKFGRREANFYNNLAKDCPIHVPTGYYATVADDDSAFASIIEDMSEHRMVDQVEGLTPEDAGRAADVIAGWAAWKWNDVAGLAESGSAVPLSAELYPAMLPGLFAEGWAKLMSTPQCHPPEILFPIADGFGEMVAPILAKLSEGPVTLLHGDYRGDNIFFDNAQTPIILDFQILGIGSPAYDLAYFVTQSLSIENASAHEKALFDRWMGALENAGVGDVGDQWLQYRRAALFCIVYPVVAARGMDLSDERQAGLVNSMMGRMRRAVDELNLTDLL